MASERDLLHGEHSVTKSAYMENGRKLSLCEDGNQAGVGMENSPSLVDGDRLHCG